MKQNSIQEEIKSTFQSGNAYCHLVQNLLSSSLLFKNIKCLIIRIKICRIIILPLFYGYETCGHSL